MTRSRTASTPWLLIPGLAIAAAAGVAGPAAPASAAVTSGPSFIDTDLAGPPAAPSMVFTGAVSQPLSGTLPGSAAGPGASGIPVTFSVSNANMLPPGVAVDPSGVVTGIPTADGVYGVGVSACDTEGCTPGVVTFTIAPDQAPCDNQKAAGLGGTLGSATLALALGTIRVLT